jgi:NAD(P)H-dependent FMN reductase
VDRQALRVAVVTQENQVGAWVAGEARQRGGVEVSVIDLTEFGFSEFSGPASAAPGRAFTARLAAAEAFVLVTAADDVSPRMRQAIGFGCAEWRAKPVAFVSYGSGSGAVEQLRSVFSELHVVTVGYGLTAFDPAASTAMFEQLEWWGRALRDRVS